MAVTIDGNVIPGTYRFRPGPMIQRRQTNQVAGLEGATGLLLGVQPRELHFTGTLHNSYATQGALINYLVTLNDLIKARTRGSLVDGSTSESYSDCRLIGYERLEDGFSFVPGDGWSQQIQLIFENLTP